jgi:phenylalanyl-tRNA synthetase beta chain
MQISLKWINELVNIKKIDLNDLIEKLTLGGFEVEEILYGNSNDPKEIALEISTTANRSDSLSIQGISTEISSLLNEKLKISSYALKMFDWKEEIEISVRDASEESCSTFLAVSVENLTNLTAPKWLKKKLIQSGLIPVNNLLDFQNYVLLETGYPFAFYDYDKICSKLKSDKFDFSLSAATSDTKFCAKNGISYQLDDSILLVKTNNIPICIGGIIESNEFAYTEKTSSLIIEASIFDAAKIRQQSRNLGLRTDRSARYEKSLKNSFLSESLYRLISLLRITNPNLRCKFRKILKNNNERSNNIILNYQTVKEILGPVQKLDQTKIEYITTKEIISYLERLNFQFSYDDIKFLWEIQIPHSRSDDLTREIDIIEEIGRLHGFNNFLTALPKIKKIGNEDPSYKTRKKITNCLLNLGFNELIHYSLTSEQKFLTNKVRLINPLLSDCSHLRRSLLPNLIQTVEENLKQGNSFVEGFEYGHIFSNGRKTPFQETEYVAGIFGGIKTKLNWSDSAFSLTWFEAKGKIEKLFEKLNLLTYWKKNYSTHTVNILHPFRSAELFLTGGENLGTFGQIHPILANDLNISLSTYLFEFNVELIQQKLQRNKLTVYQEYSSYPKIVKDLSFMINNEINFDELKETLYWNGTKFLIKINLLDEYRAESMPLNHTSLCLQLVFQSNEKTLQNKDIENIIQNLQQLLSKKFGATIR